ncbi:MAG: 3-dehydroquinate synthase [Thermoplasmata archaeon]
MNVKTIKTKEGDSIVYLNEVLSNLPHYVPDKRSIIIADKTVKELYERSFPDFEIVEIHANERMKTLDTVESIYEIFLDAEIDRHCRVIGIGGGITCDIAGFVASTYMRGLPFSFVPTTLLAQVDAAIGGKNGVNYRRYKNMIGTINQPDFVLVDYEFLKTLPLREIKNGLSELIKTAIIGSENLFDHLENNIDSILALDKKVVHRAVSEAARIKLQIVSKDEFEADERRKLNFGHTFGHAIEANLSFSHGEAVSIGMDIAVDMSVDRGMLRNDQGERIKRLISDYGLRQRTDIKTESIFEAMRKDKKRSGKNVKFVLLNEIGSAEIVDIPLLELKSVNI